MFTKFNQKALLGFLAIFLVVFVAVGCSNEISEIEKDGSVLVNFDVEERVENYYEDEVVVDTMEYELYENDGTIKDSSEVEVVDSDSISFEIDGLVENKEYQIFVTALDETGEELFRGEGAVIYSSNVKTIYIDADIPSLFESINQSEIESIESDTIRVYYDSAWADTYMHYGLDGAEWTDVPGEEMTESGDFTDYKVIEVEVDNASFIEATFNDGGNNWDNNNQENYYINDEVVTVENGTVNYGNPNGEIDDGDDEDDEKDENDDIAIYYQSATTPQVWLWEEDGIAITEEMGYSWPGPEMEEVVDADDWYLFEIPGEYLTGKNINLIFDEGEELQIAPETAWYDGEQWYNENPDSDDNDEEVEEDEIRVYYDTDWSETYIHYAVNGAEWTDVPGEAMTNSEYDGYDVITITDNDIDYIEAVFNDGGDSWDNNNDDNYILEAQVVTVENGNIINGEPDSDDGEEDEDDDDGDDDQDDDGEKLEEIPEDQVNNTMYQAFYWESYPGLWSDIADNSNEYIDAERLAEVGITSMWLPPAAKASNGTDDVGYAVYDFWDLGEFDQHGAVETRYGTRAELEDAIGQLDDLGIEAYFDVVFNHRMGGAQETAPVGWGETIESYTDMTLEGRAAHYSGADQFDWNWEEFNAVDWCAEEGEIGATLFEGKYWDNTYSDAYLMGNDVDYGQQHVREEMFEWGEWIVNEIGFAGFRMDAIAHVDSGFTDQWLDHVQFNTDDDTFFVAEAWVGNVEGYLDAVGNDNLRAFDFELRNEFVEMSSGDKDLSWWGGLINSNRAEQAVTFIDNHDTSREGNPYGQPQVTNFKNQAYAYILMREHGVPTVYARDYDEFGMADTLDKMIEARRDYAYGAGHEVSNNDYHTYSYVREGLDDVAETGLVMMISDSTNGGVTTKGINSRQPNTEFYDYTGNVDGTVTTDGNGYGDFQVREEESNGWSIWVPVE